LVILLLSTTALGADHADGTASVLFNPDASADITDVFAWMTSDATKMNLVVDVFPFATTTSKFSNAVKYVLHTEARVTPTMSAATKTDVICTFTGTTTQTIACWVVRGGTTLDYVTGDASATTGITSTSGKVKVFAGLRDDPFFFNLAGFQNTARTAARAASTLTFDTNGCPTNVPGAVAGLLAKDCTGAASPFDFFRVPQSGSNTACPGTAGAAGRIVNQPATGTGNVLAIVVQIDKTLVSDSTNTFTTVWAATTM
jgi:hypothetical protein